MEQLVMCLARSKVEVAEGDGPAISEILMNLQPSIDGDQRSRRLHLLAAAFKQARFLAVCLHPHTDVVRWRAPIPKHGQDRYCPLDPQRGTVVTVVP